MRRQSISQRGHVMTTHSPNHAGAPTPPAPERQHREVVRLYGCASVRGRYSDHLRAALEVGEDGTLRLQLPTVSDLLSLPTRGDVEEAMAALRATPEDLEARVCTTENGGAL